MLKKRKNLKSTWPNLILNFFSFLIFIYLILIIIKAIKPITSPKELIKDKCSLNITKPKNEHPATVNRA